MMTRILLLFYQAGLIFFGAVYLVSRVVRGRGLAGIRERLASYPPALRERFERRRGPVWIHLVSVGEVLTARPLVEELRRRFQRRDWVVSTVTPTGREVALKNLQGPQTEVIYLPWDLEPVVERALKRIRPALFLSFETELWPVLFDRLGRRGVPIAVVNGRISPRAYRRYLWVRPLMERALQPVSFFFAQSPQDARRFAALGAAKDRLAVSGNLKWDIPVSSNGVPPDQLRILLGLSAGQKLLTAGSTHAGEEKIILRVYARLKQEHPDLKLLIAPRHPERVPQVEQEARQTGLKTVRRSKLPGAGDAVILLDTLGDLAQVYRASEIVFVGGSLVPHGGHNLVEPASLGRPVLTGPHLQNFQAIAESLRQANGLLVVKTPADLEQAVDRLLSDPVRAKEMGGRARAVFQENQGAVQRTADLIGLRWGKILQR